MSARPLLDPVVTRRLAGLPTVWSNVLLGTLVGYCLVPWAVAIDFGHALVLHLLALVACSFASLFGASLVATQAPPTKAADPAIPSNRAALYLGGAATLTFLFLCWDSPVGLTATFALLTSHLAYAAYHRRSPLAVLPLGLSRALLYLVGFVSVQPEPGLLPNRPLGALFQAAFLWSQAHLAMMMVGLLVYSAACYLAVPAPSRPAHAGVSRWFLVFLLGLPLLTHTWWWLFRTPPFLEGWHLAIPGLLGIFPFLLWTLRSLTTRLGPTGLENRLVAGSCLVDLLAMPGLAARIATPWPALQDYPMAIALLPLGCFLLALLLQHLGPAVRVEPD